MPHNPQAFDENGGIPIQSTPAVEKYFNEVAGNYNDKSSKGIWALLRRLESVAVMKAMDPFQGMTCVELGCGAGFYANRLASYNPSLLVAVDISENMLRELNGSQINGSGPTLRISSLKWISTGFSAPGLLNFYLILKTSFQT